MIQILGDCWDDPYGNGDPYDPGMGNPEPPPEDMSGWLPPYPAPDGMEWVKPPGGDWTLQPRGNTQTGTPGRYMNAENEPVAQSDPQSYGGGGGGGGGGSAARASSGLPGFSFNPGAAPMFDAPTFNRRADFVAPEWSDVLKDPGYQFRKDQGMGALGAKYASIGNLQTGGAKKGFIDYAENLASQEYGNVYNRNLATYKQNFQGDLDSYDRLFQEKESEFKPKFMEWQTLAQLGQRGAELNFNRDWDEYTFGSDDEFRRTEAYRNLLKSLLPGGYP